jgi:uncharacterized protein
VEGGSQRYVDALIAPWRDRLRLSAPVRSVARDDEGVTITPHHGEPERYDRVVIATHADQALAMLADASAAERELLGAFPYQPNEAVLHTDTAMLPGRRRAWASWNYHLLATPTGKPTVTYHMNRLQRLSTAQQLCVTLNRGEAIDPATVIRRIDYSHPVYTRAGHAAQRRRDEISGHRRTHYCGAYWGWGFHEDCVVSALAATAELGASGL